MSTRLSEQIIVSLLVILGALSIVISILSLTEIHAPPGLIEVRVKVTKVSDGSGVYVAFSRELLSKAPIPPLHMAPILELPFKVIELPWQIIESLPALRIGDGWKLIIIVSLA